MRFWAELKRRRVVRVAIVYCAVGFAVLQAADLMLPRLGLPDWTVTFVVVLAILGLPVALALSWAFELTPEGLRRTEDVPAGTTPARWLSAPSVGIAAIALLVAAAGGWFAGRSGAAPEIPAADRSSIAVLPFVNMGDRVEDEYFSDGLAEELLNLLARVDGLQVAARTSAFAFKGRNQDVRTIGDSLGVATVLEGSVRRDGENVRVTAQLIDVASGYHLWSDSYDAELSGIFAVQERIARAIVAALEIELGTAATLAAGPAPSVAAHDLYLLGLSRFNARGTVRFEAGGTPVHEAIDYFERAVAADSTYAQAWAGLAIAHTVLPGFDAAASTLEHGPTAREAAARAIALDDRLAEPYAALCMVEAYIGWRWDEAERACDAAVERNPSSALAHHWRAELYLMLGRLEEAEADFERALALDPLSTIARMQAAQVPMNAGDLDAAERRLSAIAPIEGTGGGAGLLFMIHILRRDTAALEANLRQTNPSIPAAEAARLLLIAQEDAGARARALQLLIPANDQVAGPLFRALAHASVADDAGALDQLERAVEEHSLNLALFYGNPIFTRLRTHPRFVAIGHRMNLDPLPWEAAAAR